MCVLVVLRERGIHVSMSVPYRYRGSDVGQYCPVCGNPLTLLFLSAVCEVCENQQREVSERRGYVVYRGAMDGEVYAEHVFRQQADARQWRSKQDLHHLPIFAVEAAGPFIWQQKQGTVEGLETAKRRYLIYPDLDYAPGPHRAHVVRKS